MAAGLETLKVIEESPDFYERLEEKSKYLADGIAKSLENLGLNYTINRVGSMLTLLLSSGSDVPCAPKNIVREYCSARLRA